MDEVLSKHRKNVLGRLAAMNVRPAELTFRVVHA
jgi:hypothetical protein